MSLTLGSDVQVGVIIEDTTTALASLGFEVTSEVTIGEMTFIGDEGEGGVVTLGCI